MRELHQLGSVYLVFPSGSHSRFEHSIGTGHLGNKFVKTLTDLNYENRENIVKSVTLAGLCHNLGHAPYSYAFFDFVKHTLGIENFDLSHMSTLIFENIVETQHIDMDKEQINLINDIIVGKSKNSELFEQNSKNL